MKNACLAYGIEWSGCSARLHKLNIGIETDIGVVDPFQSILTVLMVGQYFGDL